MYMPKIRLSGKITLEVLWGIRKEGGMTPKKKGQLEKHQHWQPIPVPGRKGKSTKLTGAEMGWESVFGRKCHLMAWNTVSLGPIVRWFRGLPWVLEVQFLSQPIKMFLQICFQYPIEGPVWCPKLWFDIEC